MKLNERLRQAEATHGVVDDSKGVPAKDPLDAIRERAQIALFAKVGSRLNDATISEEELAWSRRVVEAFEANPELGVIGLDGVMLDKPHYTQAKRNLARAK